MITSLAMRNTWKLAHSLPRQHLARTLASTSSSGTADSLTTGVHFRYSKPHDPSDPFMPHPIYTKEEAETVSITHIPPEKIGDKVAFNLLQTIRRSFDFVTGYGNNMNEAKYLTRIVFLETVAGVPGMVGGMLRHLHALRKMQRDKGWIYTLLEEAENERMHLMTFLEYRKPGVFVRSLVLLGQGVFFNLYFLSYLLAPRTCHKFIGYLEEEAVKTYTKAVQDLDDGKLPEWANTPASALAKKYWHLPDDATMRDVLMAVRADEAVHRDVNHTLAAIPSDAPNPFVYSSTTK